MVVPKQMVADVGAAAPLGWEPRFGDLETITVTL
jgi:hypothetical protein